MKREINLQLWIFPTFHFNFLFFLVFTSKAFFAYFSLNPLFNYFLQSFFFTKKTKEKCLVNFSAQFSSHSMIFAENSVLIRILLSSIKIFLLARFFLKIVPFTFTENSNFPQLISFPQNIFLEKINFSSFNFVLFFASDRMWSQVRYDLATS